MREGLVEGLSRDYGVHAYGKWRGAFWRLQSLVDLGVGPGDAAALAAVEQTLEWVASPRRLATIHKRRIDGRYVVVPRRTVSRSTQVSTSGCVAIRASTRSPSRSSRRNGRTGAGTATFVRRSRTRPSTRPGGRSSGSPRTARVTRRSAGRSFSSGTMSCSRIARANRRTRCSCSSATRPYWHYDVLVGLRTLASSIGLDDARTADALDLLESKRREDGSWRAEAKWWKRPGSKGSNVEAVDWGEAASELLTEQARGVLGVAGRL